MDACPCPLVQHGYLRKSHEQVNPITFERKGAPLIALGSKVQMGIHSVESHVSCIPH